MEDKVIFRSFKEKKLSKSELKDFNINSSKIERNAAKLSKGDFCLICGRPCSSFCSSHSIPKFVLNGISTDGLVLRGMDIIKTTGIIKPVGVNSVLTFSSICNQCDNTSFQEYESPEAFKKPLSYLAVNEIAIKNTLRYLYKRKKELFQFELLLKELDERRLNSDYLSRDLENKLELAKIDVNEYQNLLKILLKKKNDNFFYVIDEINLDYNTYFAYQGFVTLINGFDRRIINDTFNYDIRYKMQRLGIAIFPFENSTKIIIFCKNGDNRLRLFYKPYSKLSLDEKLYAINYLLLMEEEEWCIPASFDTKRLDIETKNLIAQNQEIEFQTMNPFITKNEMLKTIKAHLGDRYVIQTKGNIYNFLAKHND